MQCRAHSPFSDRQYTQLDLQYLRRLPLGPDWDTVDSFHFLGFSYQMEINLSTQFT